MSYTDGDTGSDKQDCEIRAFYRLAERLKAAFFALKTMVFLAGLSDKDPVIGLFRKDKGQHRVVFKDDALPVDRLKFNQLRKASMQTRDFF
ncbi:MAG: hypothetical protein V2B19_28755 [Pseudomonadota bacterium]